MSLIISKPVRNADDAIRIRNNNPVNTPLIQPIETIVLPKIIDSDPIILDADEYTYITGLTRGVTKDTPNILTIFDQLRDGMFNITGPILRTFIEFMSTMKVVKL